MQQVSGQLPDRLSKIPKIYGPEGRFTDRDGKRFDFVFTDLLKDPTLPSGAFPGVFELEGHDNTFARRWNDRHGNCVRLGESSRCG